MGAFDDLIAPDAAPTRQPGAFDDLIAQPARYSPYGDPSRLQAFGYAAADAASFGFGDEGAGVLAGVGAALRGEDYGEAYRQRVDAARERLAAARSAHPVTTTLGSIAGAGATFLIPGAAAASGVRGVSAAGRAAQGLATGRALPYGRQLMSAAAGRGPAAVLAQGAQGARQGALFGGVYGAGAADDGDRLAGAGQGALWGGALGAAAPFVLQGLTAGRMGENAAGAFGNALTRAATGAGVGAASSLVTGLDPGQSALWGAGAGLAGKPVLMHTGGPALAAVRQAWTRPRETFGAQTGMSLGLPPISGGGQPPAAPVRIDAPTLRSVDRSLGRMRWGVDDLERQVESARAAPLGRTMADLSDEFAAEVDTLANMPGQTFTRAQEVARERAARLPEQIQSEIRWQLGVQSSPAQALDEIRAGVAAASDGYEQVLAQEPVRAVVTQRIAPLMRTPEMQGALARRFRVEEGRAQLARVRGETAAPRTIVERPDGGYDLRPEAVTGRALQDLKVAIDDELSAAVDRRALNPAGRSEQQLLDDYREAFVAAMDDALPGYAKVRAERGSLYDAERALGVDKEGVSRMGRRLLQLRPEEIARRMRETVTPTGRRRPTTPFEQQMYRIAVADEIMQRVDDYISASPDKVRNAGEVLDRVGLQNRLRAVFDETPEAIDDFLSRTIERAQMLRRAGGWTGNSLTARRVMRGGDRFMASLSEAGLGAATGGSPASAAGNIGRGAWHALRGRLMERENDALGAALLRNVERGAPDDEAFIAALLRELRRLEADRARRAISSGREGAIGGVQAGGFTDDAGGYY